MMRDSVVAVAVAVAMAAHEQHNEKINSWVSFPLIYEYGAPLSGHGAPL